MQTRVLKIDSFQPEEDKIQAAAGVLCRGGLAIIPTETVYGVAADMRNRGAVKRLYKVKQRPQNKPFSLHIAQKENVQDFAINISRGVFKLIDKFWPGPLTLILQGRQEAALLGLGR